MKNNLAKKFAVAISHGDRVFGIVPIQGQCLQRFGTETDNDHSPSNLSATKRCGASNAGAAPVTITTHVSNQPYDSAMVPRCPTTAFSWGAGRLDHWHGIQDRRGHRAGGLKAVERNEIRGVHTAQSLSPVLRSVAVV